MKVFLLGVWLVGLNWSWVQAKVYLSQEEALDMAFSGASQINRKSVFLNPEQIEEIQQTAQAKLATEIITFYEGRKDGKLMGTAFFETHNVRTMPEIFMAVVNPNGSIQFVEILAFYEPEDYRPSKRWLNLFENKTLDDNLWVKRGIRNITGSTLTTQALTEGVRRILAIYQALNKESMAQ